MIRRKPGIIIDMIPAVTHGRPFRHLLFRIDNLIGPAGKQKFSMRVPGYANQDKGRPFFLQQGRDFQGSLQIVAHCHDTQVKIRNAQGIDQLRIRSVSDFRVCHIRHGLLYLMLIFINDQHLMVQIGQGLGHMAPKASQSDQQNVFHNSLP